MNQSVNKGASVTITIEDFSLSPAEWIAGNPCPSTGRHFWMLEAANFFRHKISPDEAFALILPCVIEAGRSPGRATEREVWSQINAAYNSKGSIARGIATKWPEADLESILSLPQIDLVDLCESSPIRFDDNKPHAREVLETLFPANPLVCVSRNRWNPLTDRLSKFKNLQDFAYIVPSPMSKRIGLNQNGEPSVRCLDATGNRRFLVIDQDKTENLDLQASVIAYIAQVARLALVLHSGGKSLHAWFYCFGEPEDSILRFMQTACILGADHSLYTKSQLVRMPDGRRETGKRQQILYFNPNYPPQQKDIMI